MSAATYPGVPDRAAGSAGRRGPDVRDVRLRPLERSDLDRIDELETELFGPGAWSRRTYEAELRAPGRRYVAAVAPGGEVVGYAGVALGRESEVMTIGVTARWRRHGLGTRLLNELLATARRASARRVFLEVRATDAGARRLYEHAGFRAVGLRRGYYQPEGADAVVMRLDLDDAPGGALDVVGAVPGEVPGAGPAAGGAAGGPAPGDGP